MDNLQKMEELRALMAEKQKEIEGADVPKEVKMKALELFKKNRLPF